MMIKFLLGIWEFLISVQTRRMGIAVFKIGRIIVGLTDTKQDDKTLKWAEENIGAVLTLLPKGSRDTVQTFINKKDTGILAGLQITNEKGKIGIKYNL